MNTLPDFVKDRVELIRKNLENALFIADELQGTVYRTEGESDLHRKLTAYLMPNLEHWMHGVQAGNIKDLEDLIEKRKKMGL